MPGEHGGGPPVRIAEQIRTVVGPLMAYNFLAWRLRPAVPAAC
jgi:hypothetical protein